MNTTHLKRAAAAFGIAGLALLAVPAAAAQAAPAADPPGERHCVAFLTGGASTSVPELQCFDTFGEALGRASGGRLTTGPKNAGDAMGDPQFHAAVDAANAAAERARGIGAAVVNTVISIQYTGSGYTGSDLIWSGQSGNCSTSTNNVDYEISSMPAGWDNLLSSVKLYANCWEEEYEHTSYNGASLTYHGNRSSLGAAMDNRTSSVRWS
jgi:hypothetical protein